LFGASGTAHCPLNLVDRRFIATGGQWGASGSPKSLVLVPPGLNSRRVPGTMESSPGYADASSKMKARFADLDSLFALRGLVSWSGLSPCFGRVAGGRLLAAGARFAWPPFASLWPHPFFGHPSALNFRLNDFSNATISLRVVVHGRCFLQVRS